MMRHWKEAVGLMTGQSLVVLNVQDELASVVTVRAVACGAFVCRVPSDVVA